MLLILNFMAWSPAGSQMWMSEYTVTHYQTGDVSMEGEPIAVEVVTGGADLGPGVSDEYCALSLAKYLAWIERYPAIAAGQKAAG